MEQAVRVREKIFYPRLLQDLIESRVEPALGKPDPPRFPSQMFFMLLHGDLDLCPYRLLILHERQKSVGRTARDDLELSQVLELPERRHQVASVLFLEQGQRVPEKVPVHVRQRAELGLVLCPLNLLFGQFDQFADMPDIALLEERVREHRNEGRREAHGDAEVNAVRYQAVKNINKRNIGLGYRFIQPVFFQELIMFGMSHKGQMRMEHQCEVAFFTVHSFCLCTGPADPLFFALLFSPLSNVLHSAFGCHPGPRSPLNYLPCGPAGRVLTENIRGQKKSPSLEGWTSIYLVQPKKNYFLIRSRENVPGDVICCMRLVFIISCSCGDDGPPGNP